MTREIAAGLVLALLLAASLGNIAHLDKLIGQIEEDLLQSEAYAEAGDYDAALDALDQALQCWLAADGYTHVFIRHPEIDSSSDAFYELRQLLSERNAEGIPSAFQKLRYHLHSIDEMEHVRLGSVL
ncbi:MAG: DUF4363 family protein [Oscillospiraceae bacterium]|nr:DUF4363 family protein [Oscillospiraceae bacterium]